MTAIFRSTQQALHFAYLVESQPARDGGQLGKMLERMELDATGIAKSREISTVNFAGLTELDIRAQCSMIIAAVQTKLIKPEAWAIRSRYGSTKVDRDKSGAITGASFGPDRAYAMQQLAAYMNPQFDSIPGAAMPYLLARVCGENEMVRPRFEQIVSNFGSSLGTLHRAEKQVKIRIRELCNIGVDKLNVFFVRDGLVSVDW